MIFVATQLFLKRGETFFQLRTSSLLDRQLLSNLLRTRVGIIDFRLKFHAKLCLSGLLGAQLYCQRIRTRVLSQIHTRPNTRSDQQQRTKHPEHKCFKRGLGAG